MNHLREILRQLRANPNDNKLKNELRKWLSQNQEDKAISAFLKEHWDAVESKLPENDQRRLDQLLKEIHRKANVNSTGENEVRFLRKRSTTVTLLKIAAVLLLPVLVYSGILLTQKVDDRKNPERFIVKNAGKTVQHFFLPDSTEVWLNAASHLSYAENLNNTKKRSVTLSGQAYFKVYHDAAHPFIVQTPEIDIRVLGTSFDVSAYHDEPTISSILEEGSIAVFNKQGQQLDKLVPGEQAIYDIPGKVLNKKLVESDFYTSWKTGKLVFRNAGIVEIARKLERRFACTVTISPEILKENPSYTFSVQNEKLEEVCLLLELSSNDIKTLINGTQIRIEKKE